MSFYFILNHPFTPFHSYEQIQQVCPTINNFYPQFDHFSTTTSMPIVWTQNDQLQSNGAFSVLQPASSLMNNLPNPSIPTLVTHRSKRRMEKTLEKQLMSAKKNSESNIINQFYSFFSQPEKSQKILRRCLEQLGKTSLETQQIIPIFYNTIRIINIKRGRKYVNISMLLKFFTPEDLGDYLEDLKHKIEEVSCLTVDEFCQVFRRCVNYFLKDISVNAILTSKRISIISKEAHLKKRRKIDTNLMGA